VHNFIYGVCAGWTEPTTRQRRSSGGAAAAPGVHYFVFGVCAGWTEPTTQQQRSRPTSGAVSSQHTGCKSQRVNRYLSLCFPSAGGGKSPCLVRADRPPRRRCQIPWAAGGGHADMPPEQSERTKVETPNPSRSQRCPPAATGADRANHTTAAPSAATDGVDRANHGSTASGVDRGGDGAQRPKRCDVFSFPAGTPEGRNMVHDHEFAAENVFMVRNAAAYRRPSSAPATAGVGRANHTSAAEQRGDSGSTTSSSARGGADRANHTAASEPPSAIEQPAPSGRVSKGAAKPRRSVPSGGRG